MDNVLALSLRAVIRHLNGDITQFEEYRDKALSFYHQLEEDRIYAYPVENIIPEETKERLYEMVS